MRLRWLNFFLAPLSFIFITVGSTYGVDCNSNGVDDLTDISNSTSTDCNNNSIPDECDTSAGPFVGGSAVDIQLEVTMAGAFFPLVLVPQHIADFNHDGRADLWGVAESYNGAPVFHIFVYLNQGGTNFQIEQDNLIGGGTVGSFSSIHDVHTIDFDSDGDLDIVYRLAQSHIHIPTVNYTLRALLNDGTGNFTDTLIDLSTALHAQPDGPFLETPLANPTSQDIVAIAGGRIVALYRTAPFQYVSFDMGQITGATKLAAQIFSFNRTAIYAYNDRFIVGGVSGPGDGSLSRGPFENVVPGATDFLSVELAPDFSAPSLIRLFADSTFNGARFAKPAIATESVFQNNYTAVSANATAFAPAIDINGDQIADLPFFGSSFAEILHGDGQGRFSKRTKIFHPVDRGPAVFIDNVFDDINNRPDIFFGPAVNGSIGTVVTNIDTSLLPDALETDDDGDTVPDSCQRAVSSDFDGDRRSDLTVVRNFFGQYLWFSRFTGLPQPSDPRSPAPVALGHYGDLLFAGDFDGDGKVSPGIVNSFGNGLRWTTINGDNSQSVVDFGLTGDTPLAGYFDGDRIADRIVVRKFGNGLKWFVRPSLTPGNIQTFDFGLAGDKVFIGDTNGDGIDEAIVSRVLPSTQVIWFARISDGAVLGPLAWGLAQDRQMPPSDLDGDGKSDFIVSRVVGNGLQTFALFTGGGSTVIPFGLSGDELFFSHISRRPISELSVRRPLSRQSPEVYNRISTGPVDSLEGYFGFDTDILIGSDGKTVVRIGSVGGLACQTNVSAFDGFSWDPATSRPIYTVPASLAAQTKTVGIYNSAGVLLDTMKVKKKGSPQFVSKKLSGAQLETYANYWHVVVQTVLSSGKAYCQLIESPRFPE